MDKTQNIDLNGMSLGRAASVVAQLLLSGVKVNAYNSEKLTISGNLDDMLKKYKQKQDFKAKGTPQKGPKYPRLPHMIFKRTVRNMVPHRKTTGREALSRLKAYIGNPENVKLEVLEHAKAKRATKVITLDELSRKLGANY